MPPRRYDRLSGRPDDARPDGCVPDTRTPGIPAGTAFPYPPTAYFTGVAATDPYFTFIQKLRELAIPSSCALTTYCAESPITRGQMAGFIIRSFSTP